MLRPLLLLLVVALGGCSTAGAADTSSGLVDIGAGLRGPAGLAATAYATGLPNVASVTFDAAGRLWAATAGFEDDGTDGVYLVTHAGAMPTEVIAGLHTPLGLAWDGDVLYVASARRVDAYSDLAGTAFASHRVVLTLPEGVGEVNGLVVSPAGRLVLGISAPCDACEPSSPYAAAVVSFLPDGSDLRVEAGGIRAPVGLAYDPVTGDLYVTMNQRDDLGDATPGDWLSIVQSGQDWGFPGCYGQGGEACTGVPEPVAELDAHAAVSGVTVVDGTLAGTSRRSAIVAEWATGAVLRVGLGADPTVDDFVTGLSKPVAVAAAPGGALLVGDWGTGTIYRIAPA